MAGLLAGDWKVELPRDSIFKRKFGSIGQAFSSSLPFFSLDVVGLICSYAVCGVPTTDSKPKLLFTIGPNIVPGSETDSAFSCNSISSTADGRIWIGDGTCVRAFDCDGHFLHRVDDGSAPGMREGIAISQTEAFVSVSSRNSIAVCDLEGKLLRSFDSRISPFDICLVGEEALCVVDGADDSVKILRRKDGAIIRQWKMAVTGYFTGTRTTFGVAASPRRELWICATQPDHRVQVFDEEGRALFSVRGPKYPVQVAFDRAGNALVVHSGVVCVYTPNGALICSFATRIDESGGPRHGSPCCIHVDREGRILIGDDACTVRVFAFEM